MTLECRNPFSYIYMCVTFIRGGFFPRRLKYSSIRVTRVNLKGRYAPVRVRAAQLSRIARDRFITIHRHLFTTPPLPKNPLLEIRHP